MKRILALLAALLLLCGTALAAPENDILLIAPAPSPAAPAGPYAFVRTRTYDGQFSDLTRDSVFYDNVSALYEYGLSVGKTDGTFGLTDPVTVSQGIIFAGRLRSFYELGDTELGAAAFRSEDPAQPVYEPYLLYLQSVGALGDELYGQYFTYATRSAMAHILACALPRTAYENLNGSTVTQCYAARTHIRDVSEYTEYYQDILALYRWGICQGVDAVGSFLPGETITRGALAAMLTRMADPALRTKLDWDTHSLQGISWHALIPAGTHYPAPATPEEFDATVRHMLISGSTVLELDYLEPPTEEFLRPLLKEFLAVLSRYPEQMLNQVSCTYSTDKTAVTLTFSSLGITPEESAQRRSEVLQGAAAVHDFLWDSGLINENTSAVEKARIYYRWICENCVYDYGADRDSLSHTAWSVFNRGIGVCDGYTGAYNLLLKLEGIECYALSSPDHMWTVAVLDGQTLHIDTTWGDSSGTFTDFSYFGMTPEQSWSHHSW